MAGAHRSSTGSSESQPRYFASAAAFRRWLEANHGKADGLWIAFWKAHTGKAGLTYLEAVDEALCFGWIDGLKKRLDDHAFVQRFTPRKARSTWSHINIGKVEALTKAGRMAPAGLAAFEGRDPARVGIYSFENRDKAALDATLARRFKAQKAAWSFFETQPPGYRRLLIFWVTSAKQAATRERRLARLIDHCARGRRLGELVSSGKKAVTG